MAEGAVNALGLSIGATNLAAVTAGHAFTRKPVLTLYRRRPPEVGLPAENPKVDQPGLVITDFVDRVGGQAGVAAADGSMHRSEVLVADALRALAYAATGGHSLPENTAVTYPAHWRADAVGALDDALGRVAEWSNRTQPLALLPDAAAALVAARADPGVPARGTVAVCDFGGRGTSITLVDGARDYRPVAATVRHRDFCGDLIDQLLLHAVMTDMPGTGSFDPSRALLMGGLSRLRAGCRNVKEQLSAESVATLTHRRAGMRRDVSVTRRELDDAIREPLQRFLAALENALRRNGVRDLVAVVSVGGGANIPAVTTALSACFEVPVVTMPRPQLAAAVGAALWVSRRPGETDGAVAARAAEATPQQPVAEPETDPA